MGRPAGHSATVAGRMWLPGKLCFVWWFGRPAFVDKDCSRLFRSLGRICVLDVHVGHTGSPGDDPRKSLPPLPMSPGDRGVSLSLLVPLMGKSRRSGITGVE